MELRKRRVGDLPVQDEYVCDLTEFLDQFRDEGWMPLRHYIIASELELADGILPIRLPGCTVGAVYLDENQTIRKVVIDGNAYKELYPEDINELVVSYIGQPVTVGREEHGEKPTVSGHAWHESSR